jgi:GalNAc-alpha-(1->4)-GalNAc-alpha-(1->3)-diNAcBac-PP-undecaprenol alpha-1,4-N-acetyl-D-galactosaminyltransferase
MERVMSELAYYFCQKSKYQVHLILFGSKREIFYRVPDNLIIHKPEFHFNQNLRIWHTLKTIFFLRKKIKSINPSSILSFGEIWNNLVLISLFGLKYNIFISDRCSPSKRWSRTQEVLRKWLYPSATGIICQTEVAKKIYQILFRKNNIQVIGNPIRVINPNQNIPKDNIVLSVGRLIKTKHHDVLIKIFAALNPENWKLVIVGDDALEQKNKVKLEALIKELNMQDKILLAGKRVDVDDFYRRAKIFAFTSSSEGFPNVIGEAMSAGLPVVAFDCVTGPSDLIEHGETGFLITQHNLQDFKSSLNLLVNDESLRLLMGAKAKKKIQEFSISCIGQKFEKVLINDISLN